MPQNPRKNKQTNSEAELWLYTGLIVLEKTIRMVVLLLFTLLLKIWIWNVTLGLQMRIADPSRVELIGKRSLFGLDTTTNR